MSGITFSGISSGIDTGAIIESFVHSERASIRSLEAQKTNYNTQLTSIRDLNSKMQKLEGILKGMSEVGDFLKYDATFGKSEAMDLTANGSATPGMYDVKVVQLAQAERNYSKEFASKTEAGLAGEGKLSITVGGGEQVEINILASDNLQDIVNKINSSEASVTASLLYTGSSYRMQITGTDSGAQNSISFAQNGSLDLTLNRYMTAQDAIIEVDGHTITSETNTFSDAIAGVTINARAKTDVAHSLEIKADTKEIESSMKAFIDSYNDIMDTIKSDKTSNSTMRSLQLQFGMMIANQLGDVGGIYNALSQIGVATGSNGRLSLKSTDFNAALARDARGVALLFAGSDDGNVKGISEVMKDFVGKYISRSDGVFRNQEIGLKKMISGIDNSILREEERISSYQSGLVSQFTAMELQMSMLQSQQSYLGSMFF